MKQCFKTKTETTLGGGGRGGGLKANSKSETIPDNGKSFKDD